MARKGEMETEKRETSDWLKPPHRGPTLLGVTSA